MNFMKRSCLISLSPISILLIAVLGILFTEKLGTGQTALHFGTA